MNLQTETSLSPNSENPRFQNKTSTPPRPNRTINARNATPATPQAVVYSRHLPAIDGRSLNGRWDWKGTKLGIMMRMKQNNRNVALLEAKQIDEECVAIGLSAASAVSCFDSILLGLTRSEPSAGPPRCGN